MKIRQGFVSNSSSSSFVLMAKKDEFLETLEEMHPYIKHMVGKSQEVPFGEDTMVMFMGVDSSEDHPYELENYLEGEVLNRSGEVVGNIVPEAEVEIYNYKWIDDVAYKGDCLYLISEKMKEQEKSVVYKTEQR